jgi:transcription elongation factor GreA
MQLPYRKTGKYTHTTHDPIMTRGKLTELKNSLEKSKNKRKLLMSEVSRLAEMGDFSENVEYQLAKGQLRKVNSSITTLEHRINTANIIEHKNTDRVGIGHLVSLDDGECTITYRILGSSEVDITRGVISHSSPLGSVLIGKGIGDSVELTLPKKVLHYKIVEIKN